MFPFPIFCITLPECADKKAAAAAHFKERKVEARFFDGIHAEKAGLSTVHPYEVDNPGTGFRIGFKCTGIFLSHYMLWAALNLLHDDYFMVLEDDAMFPENWHIRVTNALQDVPKDFDMLYIGSCCCKNKPMTQIKNDVWHIKWPLCTQAYVVAKKALPVLLATQRKIYAPVDISLAFHSHPLLKIYTVYPRIIDQFGTQIEP